MFDIHSHILPGVDDGSSCIEETMLLVDMEYAQGVRNLVLTPHFRASMFEIAPQVRVNVYNATYRAIKSKYPDMNVYLGCEVYLNEASVTCLGNPANRMLGTDVVLVEFQYDISFNEMIELIRKVQKLGLKVIIAHIERYDAIRGTISNASILKTLGCYLQVNAGTIAGKHGFKNKLFADKLLKCGYVDFVASDCHDVKLRKVYLDKAYKHVGKKFGEDAASSLFYKNAEALLIKGGRR